MRLHARAMKTRHGNVYVAIFEEGDLSKPIAVLDSLHAVDLAKEIAEEVKAFTAGPKEICVWDENPCAHLFVTDCGKEYTTAQSTCPNCGREVRL